MMGTYGGQVWEQLVFEGEPVELKSLPVSLCHTWGQCQMG